METLMDISAGLRQFWGAWLMLCFLFIVAWTLKPRNKARFDQSAMIPFVEDGEEGGTYGRNS